MASKQSRLFVCLYRQLLAVNQAIFHNFFLCSSSAFQYMLLHVRTGGSSNSIQIVVQCSKYKQAFDNGTQMFSNISSTSQLESVKLSKCVQLLIWPISKIVKLHYKFYFDYHKELFRLGVLYFILSYSVYVNARVSLGYPYN